MLRPQLIPGRRSGTEGKGVPRTIAHATRSLHENKRGRLTPPPGKRQHKKKPFPFFFLKDFLIGFSRERGGQRGREKHLRERHPSLRPHILLQGPSRTWACALTASATEPHPPGRS